MSVKDTKGVTVVELLVVLLIVGILASILGLTWNSFVARQEVRATTDRVYWALQSGKTLAKANKVSTEVCFKKTSTETQYSAHKWEAALPCANAKWQKLSSISKAEIDIDNSTFLRRIDGDSTKWRSLFNWDGTTRGRLGRIVIKSRQTNSKGCVFVSTLLGAMRTAQDEDCNR